MTRPPADWHARALAWLALGAMARGALGGAFIIISLVCAYAAFRQAKDYADTAVAERRTPRDRVLQSLSDEWRYGLDLMRSSGLRSGRFYPVIDELEQAGQVEARWADPAPGRQYRRRMYRLSPLAMGSGLCECGHQQWEHKGEGGACERPGCRCTRFRPAALL